MSNTVNISEIKTAAKIMQKIRETAGLNKKNWGWELSLEDFALAMSILNPQSYGNRIDNRIADILELMPTNNKDRGDKKSFNSEHHELKGSLITCSNLVLNMVQIRPWQNVNYIIYCFDVRDIDNINTQFFYLTKNQMKNEMVRCGSTSAHGTKNANLSNKHKELALRLEIYNSNYFRWINEYGISLEDLKIKLLNQNSKRKFGQKQQKDQLLNLIRNAIFESFQC
jgi:hypothetical protein